MAITKVYNEDSIVTLNYREAVRNAIGMYIGNSESSGMHHLLEEIVCNFCDADSSNCSYCSVRDQIIDALLNNNIEIEEPKPVQKATKEVAKKQK